MGFFRPNLKQARDRVEIQIHLADGERLEYPESDFRGIYCGLGRLNPHEILISGDHCSAVSMSGNVVYRFCSWALAITQLNVAS